MFRWFTKLLSKLFSRRANDRCIPARLNNLDANDLDANEYQDEGEEDVFRFAPELFEVRTDVMAELSDRGFDWLSHYSAVDPIHDTYGIEVCGIHDQEDAVAIQNLLIELFPRWRPG